MQRSAVLKEQGVVFSVLNYFTKHIAKEISMRYNIFGGNLFGVELT